MRALFGMSGDELRALMEGLGERPFRAKQLVTALYKQRVSSVEEISTLPVETRARLVAEGFAVGLPELAQTAKSVDGTERYLVKLADGETVETVWMPDGDGAAEEDVDTQDPGTVRGTQRVEPAYKRATICVSSQVWLRGQLPVLPDGEAWDEAQPHGRRDRRTGGGGAEPA